MLVCTATYRLEYQVCTLCELGELVEILEGANDCLHPKLALEDLPAFGVADEGGDIKGMRQRMGEDALQTMAADVSWDGRECRHGSAKCKYCSPVAPVQKMESFPVDMLLR